MHRSLRRLDNMSALKEFVDTAYLNNKRPLIPGGAWTVELLRRKITADLQQIWFAALKEKNMLLSMQEHYRRYSEELGAMPAPSRIDMSQKSLDNIKQVMRERDNEATDRAIAIFRERLEKGVYRWPPGPQPPPNFDDPRSFVKVTCGSKISEDRLRELFGRFDVFESHKGIASIELTLPQDVLDAKHAAETAFEEYQTEVSDWDNYHRYDGESHYDNVRVELAPEVFLEEKLVASEIPVPPPAVAAPPPANTLERLRWERKPAHEKVTIQLGHYPNLTSAPPLAPRERPQHPDEIEGPWTAVITYDTKDGADYALGLNITNIDGVQLTVEKYEPEREPYANRDPAYQEAKKVLLADEEEQKNWPHIPTWNATWNKILKKPLDEVITHNYNNVADYVERELLLTGKSLWEKPIKVDPFCGQAYLIPPHVVDPMETLPIHTNMDHPAVRNIVPQV